MKSSKTHRNKAFILASVYSWLETFEKYAPYSTKINACRQHLRNFSNNAKHHSKYQLTPDFDEHSMICKGRFFTPKEYVVYIQWTISRFNALVDKIVQQQEEAEEEGEEYQVTVEQGWEMQRLLLTLMFSFSGGYRREVIGRLRRDKIRVNSDQVLLSDMTREKAERSKTTEVPLPGTVHCNSLIFLNFLLTLSLSLSLLQQL
jgi:hypothetical protein